MQRWPPVVGRPWRALREGSHPPLAARLDLPNTGMAIAMRAGGPGVRRCRQSAIVTFPLEAAHSGVAHGETSCPSLLPRLFMR